MAEGTLGPLRASTSWRAGAALLLSATLVATDSTFTENRAAGAMFGSAGAVLNEGSGAVMVLDHCTFTGNQATASLGAGPIFFQGNAVGGAVKNSAGGQATLLHTTFEGNLARYQRGEPLANRYDAERGY